MKRPADELLGDYSQQSPGSKYTQYPPNFVRLRLLSSNH